ncbi:hypothetical protein KC347_g158 [Hortaea werneckii]|nr:hypothetical protein KC347_g158 [Hortaea werneckii]
MRSIAMSYSMESDQMLTCGYSGQMVAQWLKTDHSDALLRSIAAIGGVWTKQSRRFRSSVCRHDLRRVSLLTSYRRPVADCADAAEEYASLYTCSKTTQTTQITSLASSEYCSSLWTPRTKINNIATPLSMPNTKGRISGETTMEKRHLSTPTRANLKIVPKSD